MKKTAYEFVGFVLGQPMVVDIDLNVVTKKKFSALVTSETISKIKSEISALRNENHILRQRLLEDGGRA